MLSPHHLQASPQSTSLLCRPYLHGPKTFSSCLTCRAPKKLAALVRSKESAQLNRTMPCCRLTTSNTPPCNPKFFITCCSPTPPSSPPPAFPPAPPPPAAPLPPNVPPPPATPPDPVATSPGCHLPRVNPIPCRDTLSRCHSPSTVAASPTALVIACQSYVNKSSDAARSSGRQRAERTACWKWSERRSS
ncbi:unnamed protein product, partial [Closterium sp. NIES-53]